MMCSLCCDWYRKAWCCVSCFLLTASSGLLPSLRSVAISMSHFFRGNPLLADKPNKTPVNDHSFCYFVSALRQLMPTKLITLYFIGDAILHLSCATTAHPTPGLSVTTHLDIGTLIDFAWNPYYDGSFAPPGVDHMEKRQLSGAAVNCTSNSRETVADLARQTVSGGYGVFMWYNLTGTDASELLTAGSEILHNQKCVYSDGSKPNKNKRKRSAEIVQKV